MHKQDLDLVPYLETEGYYNIRVLEDGVIANFHMLFTDAVVIGLDKYGYQRRICYPKHAGLAEAMCKQMQTFDDEPLPGYTALK